MPADIRLDMGSTPTVSPDAVAASHAADVWFEYDLTNYGDEAGNVGNVYYTLDAPDGSYPHSEFVPDAFLEPGQSTRQGCRIDSSVFAALPAGDYWVTLRTPEGDTMGGALLTVAP